MSLSNTHKFTEADCEFVARSLSSSELLKNVSLQIATDDHDYTLVVDFQYRSDPPGTLRYSFDDLHQNLVPVFNAMPSREAFMTWLVRRITAAIVAAAIEAPAKAPAPSSSTSLDVQVGGAHYKDMAIQPVQFIHANGLDYLTGNVIKYVCRHKTKNGVQDLLKARHYLDLLLELEYGFSASPPNAAQPGPAETLPGQPPWGADALDARRT